MKHVLLIIDDDEKIAQLVEAIARQYQIDLQIVSADSGAKGIWLARVARPDLVLLDVKLPDIDGMELCRLLRQHPATKDLRILLMSGMMTGPEDRLRGLQSGANDYIFKPFCIDALVASLQMHTQPKQKEAQG